MTDFMQFLYAHYIRPYLNEQPRDAGDFFTENLYLNELPKSQRQLVEPVIAYAAVHGFLLGARTGAGLCDACGGADAVPRFYAQ